MVSAGRVLPEWAVRKAAGSRSVATDSDADKASEIDLRCHPDPFTSFTTIEFSLLDPMSVHLTVHDLLGREIAVLFDGEAVAGTHAVRFDAGELPSGTYLYRIAAEGSVLTRTMHLVR